MIRRVALAALLALASARPVASHVNSPHEHREAVVAGRPVVAVVHLPRAVPGEAEAALRILDLHPGESVDVAFRQVPPQGDAHAPEWIAATRSPADPAFFTAPMPLMVFGLFEAEFRLRTSNGEGTIRLPVTARNPEPMRMPAPLAGVLLLLTAFLTSSAFAIGRAAASDGSREESIPRTRADSRRGWMVGALAAGAFLVFVTFSCVTWRLMHRAFEARTAPPVVADWIVRSGTPRVDKPLEALVTLVGQDGRPATGLLEDGGELVHVTAIAMPGATHVVHVHGRRTPTGAFELAWVPREAGRTTVFVDYATRDAGQLTIVQEAIVGPAVPAGVEAAMIASAPRGTVLPPIGDPRARQPRQPLGSGWVVAWDPPPAAVPPGELVTLRFDLQPEGDPAPPLDAARAELIVLRNDAQVYDRLLPAPVDPGAGAAPSPTTVRFVYGFPQPGAYRMMLSVPDAGGGRAAAFDVEAR